MCLQINVNIQSSFIGKFIYTITIIMPHPYLDTSIYFACSDLMKYSTFRERLIWHILFNFNRLSVDWEIENWVDFTFPLTSSLNNSYWINNKVCITFTICVTFLMKRTSPLFAALTEYSVTTQNFRKNIQMQISILKTLNVFWLS